METRADLVKAIAERTDITPLVCANQDAWTEDGTMSAILWVLACTKLGPTSRGIFKSLGLTDFEILEKICGTFPHEGIPSQERIKYALQLIEAGANMNLFCQFEEGISLLTYSIRFTYRAFATMLINAGADPNGVCPGFELMTNVENHPITEALTRGAYTIVEVLIEKGADVNWIDVNGRCVFNYVCDELQYFFTRSAAPCFVEKLLTIANHDLIDSSGRTPLQHVVRHQSISSELKYDSQMEAVIHVIKSGKLSDLDIKDKRGRTLLMYAAKRADFFVASALIESGCSLEITDDSNQTAMHIAAESYVATPVIDLLVNAGADINAGNPPPIYCAAQKNLFDNVKSLLQYNADVTFQVTNVPPLNVVDHGPSVMALLILAGRPWDCEPSVYKEPCGYARSKTVDVHHDYTGLPRWMCCSLKQPTPHYQVVKQLRDKFIKENTPPVSLSHLCRLKIRGMLGVGIKDKLEQLEISAILKEYLQLPEMSWIDSAYPFV